MGGLSGLQTLRLLRMPLLHLLGLLLVTLLHLLLLGLGIVLLLRPLMLLFLPLLELLMLLILFRGELLLLLILLIPPGVSGAGRRWYLVGLNLTRMRRVVAVRRSCSRMRLNLSGTCRIAGGCSAASGGRVIRRACFLRSHDAGTAEGCRSLSCSDRGLALIRGGTKLRIGARHLYVLSLSRDGRKMPFVRYCFFLGSWTDVDAAVVAVVADAILDAAVHDGFVIDVVNVDDIHVHDRAVVEEMIALPATSLKAVTEVAETVIDAAIESDMRAPIPV